MDTSTTPTSSETSDTSLTADQAGQAFAAMLDPVDPPEKEGAEPAQVETAQAEPNAQEEGGDAPSDPNDEMVTVRVDGKDISLTKAQIAEAHKSGLRQEDYTRKTQELAEQRKATEAETAKTRETRDQYVRGLQQADAVLTAQVQEYQNVDWRQLLKTDPVAYMEHKQIAEERQLQLQQTRQQLGQASQQSQAEHQTALAAHVESQRTELIAKIPEWKDPAVMKAEATELRDYLKTQGLSEQEIYSVTDHRAIIQSRKAMLFDKMIAKASVATKRVQNTPQRVERPQGGDTANVDKRSQAYARLSKTGSVDAAGSIFANMFT